MKKSHMQNVMVAIFVMVILLTSCSSESKRQSKKEESSFPDYITVIEDGIWPQNDYTKDIPVPPGNVIRVYIDTQHQCCTINMDDVSEVEYIDYITQLKEDGFTEIWGKSEEIENEDYTSTVAILSNNTQSLSIAYTKDSFGIYITKNTQK